MALEYRCIDLLEAMIQVIEPSRLAAYLKTEVRHTHTQADWVIGWEVKLTEPFLVPSLVPRGFLDSNWSVSEILRMQKAGLSDWNKG